MKKLIFLFLLICNLASANEIPIFLEFAKTDEEKSLGLMQRSHLRENSGMLFIYPVKERIKIWMLNTLIDLSVAFLDENGVILEIHELKAYPEKMKEKTPDIRFFLEKSVKSSVPVSFALEMNSRWFYNHDVLAGDVLKWEESKPQAFIVRKSSTPK